MRGPFQTAIGVILGQDVGAQFFHDDGAQTQRWISVETSRTKETKPALCAAGIAVVAIPRAAVRMGFVQSAGALKGGTSLRMGAGDIARASTCDCAKCNAEVRRLSAELTRHIRLTDY